MDVIFIEPILRNYIWGGTNLKSYFNKKSEFENIAESIEITVNNDESVKIKNGEYKGKLLYELYENSCIRKKIFGKYCINKGKFPIKIKLIDAKENLSIQVHPAYELNRKDELWYIIKCSNNAKIIGGIKNIITKKQLVKYVENNQLEKIVNYINIKEGDSVYIKSGTVHAILKDTIICEVQQNSDVTYRIYDWDRKNREIHKEQAYKSIKLFNKLMLIPQKRNKNIYKIIKNKNFYVERIKIKNSEYKSKSNKNTLFIFNVLEGNGIIYDSTKSYRLRQGNTFIIPAMLGEYKICGNLMLIKTSITK